MIVDIVMGICFSFLIGLSLFLFIGSLLNESNENKRPSDIETTDVAVVKPTVKDLIDMLDEDQKEELKERIIEYIEELEEDE
jgi:hypothetical protein